MAVAATLISALVCFQNEAVRAAALVQDVEGILLPGAMGTV